jgi:hypothetical protein
VENFPLPTGGLAYTVGLGNAGLDKALGKYLRFLP